MITWSARRSVSSTGRPSTIASMFVENERGGLLDPALLVHLERQLRHDDRRAVLADLFGVGDAAQHDLAAAGAIRAEDAVAALDHAGGREVGTRAQLEQRFIGQLRIGDRRASDVDDLAED